MPEKSSRPRGIAVIVGWLAVAFVSSAVIWLRLGMTVDLAFFLPTPESRQEQVLIDRLGQGPGSRLLFVAVHGSGQADLQNKSSRLKTILEQSTLFSKVLNGQEELSVAAIPDEVWRYRYLLNDIDWSVAGMRAAMRERLADLTLLSGAEISTLIGADPYLASVTVMESLAGASQARDAAWIDEDNGTAYLIAESAAPAFDVGAQSVAVEFIRDAAATLNEVEAELHGVGVYGVGLQKIIRSEARFRSLLATVAIMAVLFAAYRRVKLVLLAALPLVLGGLAGLAAVALLFGEVHGITLAFGFTLFGVAVDYPLHLFSHAHTQSADRAIGAIWRTMRLGALSTVLAYLALAASGSRGLAQLGCLSAVGVVVALYATRTLLPALLPTPEPIDASGPGGAEPESRPALRQSIWLTGLVAGAVALTAQDGVWTNDLASLTPLPPETLQKDNALRDAFGAPDIRFLLLLQAGAEETALQLTEKLQKRLPEAQRAGLFSDALTVTTILPSERTQVERREALRAIGDLGSRVAAASETLPYRGDAFDEFIADAQRSANLALLTSAGIQDSLLTSFVSNHLYFDGENWNSTVTLYGLTDPVSLEAWLEREMPAARLIDLKSASESLVLNYRMHVITVLGAAFVVIAAMLVWRVGFGARLLWVIGTLAGAIALTVALNALLLEQLSIFNLIALVLVAGLGLDYALFMSRAETRVSEALRTRHALRVCAGSTMLAFGVLAFSSVPILASIGLPLRPACC